MAQVSLTFTNDVFTSAQYGVANYSGTLVVDYTTNTFTGPVTFTNTPYGTLFSNISGTVGASAGSNFTLSGSGTAVVGPSVYPISLSLQYTGTNPTFTNTVVGTAGASLGTVTYSTVNDLSPVSPLQPVTSVAVCFAADTLIRTVDGDVVVERLQVGDLSSHPTLETVWPVRVQRGAFGENKPSCDLWLSPAHAVFVDGALVEIGQLVNGATIAQVPRESVTCWHVELDTHDVILAEGLEAETYLDTGNRRFFAGEGNAMALYPGDVSSLGGTPCVPFIEAGPRLAAIRQRLLDRAEVLGHAWTADPDLHVVADGRRVDAVEAGEGHAVFDLPPAKDIRLVSRTWKRVEATATQDDYRTLDVEVWRLTVDCVPLPLSLVREGFHAPETDGTHVHRWTTGNTPLPRGCRRVVVEFNAKGRYHVAQRLSASRVRRWAKAV